MKAMSGTILASKSRNVRKICVAAWLVFAQLAGIGFLIIWFGAFPWFMLLESLGQFVIFFPALFYPLVLVVFSIVGWRKFANDELYAAAIYLSLPAAIGGLYLTYLVYFSPLS